MPPGCRVASGALRVVFYGMNDRPFGPCLFPEQFSAPSLAGWHIPRDDISQVQGHTGIGVVPGTRGTDIPSSPQ
ncbi:Hypp5997 [Branchiostoma lanceolatum]|uniref:Hypp5997 protein n=1 Tax=Branchiostoma lanceolatum TaxID=7740 RepID=A0A8J9VT79_BRALA|nr:Hypp5997 [Branchiostoma lanceolatum]